MRNSLSFARDIRPLFREIDVDHMKRANLDLSDYATVKAKARAIEQAVAEGSMPPRPDPPWSAEMVTTLKAWIDEGCPP